MKNKLFFTICAPNYLAQAILSYKSFKRKNPLLNYKIILVSEQKDPLLLQSVPSHDVILHSDLFASEFIAWYTLKYNVIEYCTLLKPHVLKKFLAGKDFDYVSYIDPDTCFYSDVQPIYAELEDRLVHVTPHLIEMKEVDSNPYPEFLHLWEGIYNLGYITLKKSNKTNAFLSWWINRLNDYCYADKLDGLHTDQKWIDYAPAFLGADFVISQNFGLNISHWNLNERDVLKSNDVYLVNDQSLIFWHFSGFKPDSKNLNKNNVFVLSDLKSEALNDIFTNYRDDLCESGYDYFSGLDYEFDKLKSGESLNILNRRLFRVYTSVNNLGSSNERLSRFLSVAKSKGIVSTRSGSDFSYGRAGLDSQQSKLKYVHFGLKIFLRLFGAHNYLLLIRLIQHFSKVENHYFLMSDERK